MIKVYVMDFNERRSEEMMFLFDAQCTLYWWIDILCESWPVIFMQN